MKSKIFSCLFLSFSVFLLPNLQAQERTKKVNKKISRAIEKIWKNKLVEEIQLTTDINDEFDWFFEDNQLSLLKEGDKTLGFLLLRRGYGCQIGGCGTGTYAEGATCTADGVTYETFDYIVFFDKNRKVLKMEVVDYPGDYGYEICSKNWLKQFIGYDGQELQYKSDIDGISGATISAISITSDIQQVHQYLTRLLNLQKADLITNAINN